MMLRTTLIALLLCFAGSVWSEEEGAEGIEAQGGSIRGPRILEHKAESGCKEEKNWPICSDEDWGPKCPSGCRIQGLTDKTDKDFGKRINAIKQKLKDNESNHKSIDVRTKETYELIKDNLIQAQQSDGKYNQVSEDLRKKIEYLKLKVSNQIQRIKLLQKNIRDQVVEMKRLEVDIDIKIRACKGSCAKNVDYKVDRESYNNIQKQLLQAESTDLNAQMNDIRVLKMRPIKDSPVDSRYKAQAVGTEDEEQFPLFKDIDHFKFVLEGKREVNVLTSGSSTDTFSPSDKKEVGSDSKNSGPGVTTQPGKTIISTKHVSCSKTIKKTIVQTPDGPREEITETYSGGPQCENVGKLVTEENLENGSESTRTIHVSGNANLGDIHSFDDILSMLEKKPSKTSSSSVDCTSCNLKEVTQDHFTGEFDDFGHAELDSPSFTPFQKESSSSFSKTVITSSSKGSSNAGDQYETKYMKSGPVFEDFGPVQLENSEEDRPDFQARTVKKEVKLVGDYTGTDCDDIRQKHSSGAKSGIFKIKQEGSNKVFSVYCDQDTLLGGWILIQQRENGSVHFNRTWEEYKNGFGEVDANGKGEVWLGNDLIHFLTQKDTILRVELEDWSGGKVYAEYNFQLGSELEGYVLKVSHYDGTAGDALIEGSKDDGDYTSHVNMKFSTFDRDNDKWEENCAEMYGGGWWYNNCQASNLNGVYYHGGQYDPRNNVPYEIENGIVWLPFKAADYSLRTVRMKIRPIETSG
ncbi:hypothetical protein GDO86_000574 [Hymenochirus boettgeri]|uniref:Fibrinogen C-terminal domain-containing protein n=1 Tax=Hymenochirus boettgeri TaxID=247094 RepID=A0A8T2KA26_9PIPI|nr:hypothetical protein GDO86_000574 [Hymenochirus boettgeri]